MSVLISDNSAVKDNGDGTKTTTRSVVNGTPEAAGLKPEGAEPKAISGPSAPPSDDHFKLRPAAAPKDAAVRER